MGFRKENIDKQEIDVSYSLLVAPSGQNEENHTR